MADADVSFESLSNRVPTHLQLVAARGSFHLDIPDQDSDNMEKPIEWFKSIFRPIHPNLANRMYWVSTGSYTFYARS